MDRKMLPNPKGSLSPVMRYNNTPVIGGGGTDIPRYSDRSLNDNTKGF